MKLLFLFLLPTLLAAQTIDEPLRLNLDQGTTEQVGPLIATGPDGAVYVAWVDLRENTKGDIYLRRSDDGGASFSDEIVVYEGGQVPAGRWRSVAMEVAPNGTVHMAWVETIGPVNTDIRYTRSTDRGETFTPPVSVVDATIDAIEDFPSIAIDSSGTVHIAWIDGRELKQGTDEYDQIWATRSFDDGVTFEEPRRASFAPGGVGGSCECCPTASATTPDGDLLIAYRSNVNNVRDIFVARSTDGGETFGTAIPIPSQSWNLFACPVAGPGIAVDRFGTAHIVWKDGREGAGDQYMYYTILPDGADRVPHDFPLSTELTRTNHPTVGITPQGGVFTTFDSYRSLRNRVNYLASFDGGNTFVEQASLVLPGSGTNRQLSELAIGPDGTRYLIWQDDAEGNSDILFAVDRSTVSVLLPMGSQPVTPTDGATIGPEDFLSWTAPPNLTATGRVIYDLQIESTSGPATASPTVAGITAWQAGDLPNGDYRWRVRARTSTGESVWSEYSTFTMSGSSSVNDMGSADVDLTIGPNPIASGGKLNMTATFATPSSDILTITLIASDGRRVAELFRGVVADNAFHRAFDLDALSGGAYWLVMERAGERIVRGVVVVR